MANGNWLYNAGFTNSQSEDLGAISCSKNKLYYDYFCFSFTCAGSYDGGKFITTSDLHVGNCPNCKGLLYSKRSKKKKAEIAI